MRPGSRDPEYRHTRLWQESLGPQPSGAFRNQRKQLREALEATRENVLPMVEQISRDLPDFTVHDEDHLDALWLIAEAIGGDEIHFNPAEGFVFGLAVLLHDLGLAVAAYPGGREHMRGLDEWRDAFGEIVRSRHGRAPDATDFEAPRDDDAAEADRVILRERHAEQALDLARITFGPDDTYLVPHEEVREGFAHIGGVLAASHWWPVSKLRELTDKNLAIAQLPAEWEVDVLKLACLLRLADYAHLDSRRAPKLRRLQQQPQGESLLHWDFQGRLARAKADGGRLRFRSFTPFGRDEADAWWLAADMLSAVDEELRQVDALRRDLAQAPFAVDGVAGAGDPRRLAQTVETTGWEPVDATLRISDVTSLVRRLGGARLYGELPVVPLREAIQNATDAISARAHLHPDFVDGVVSVTVEPAGGEGWLSVEVHDNGVGMAPEVLAGPLLDFGRSLWRDGSLRSRLPGLAATGFEPIGRFGIGFFSVFMFDRPVRVRSRFLSAAVADTYVLEFPKGLSRRALVRRAESGEQLALPGTVVSFFVHDPKGQLANPPAGLARLCPTLEVDLVVRATDGPVRVVSGGDWRELPEADLMRRLGPQLTPAQLERVRPLHGSGGELVGRLVALPHMLYMGGHEPPAALTVGGLTARRGGAMAGVLLGEEPNLARSSAWASVSNEEFGRWASEQAQLWTGAGLSVSDAIGLAGSVARNGGDIDDLPVCYSSEGPLSRLQLGAWATERSKIFLWPDIDDDELREAGGYNPRFTPGPDTIVIDEPVRSADLADAVANRGPQQTLIELVYEQIAAAWGQSAQHVRDAADRSDGEVIGHSEVDDIRSYTALVLKRAAED
jgi:hypothetical protein